MRSDSRMPPAQPDAGSLPSGSGEAATPPPECLVENLRAGNFPHMFDAIDREFTGTEREFWRKEAMLRGAQVAPAAAFSFAWQFAGGSECYLFTDTVQAWLRQDAPSAVSAVRNLPAGLMRDEMLSLALREFTRQNPAAALDFIQSLPPGAERGAAVYNIAIALADESPDLALLLAEILPESRQRSDAMLTAQNAIAIRFPSL